MTNNQSWECPRCRRIHAPHIAACNCPPAGMSPYRMPDLPDTHPPVVWPYVATSTGSVVLTSGSDDLQSFNGS